MTPGTAPTQPGPKDHTDTSWFKSTLLLFLRLLLSTKKRWPAKPFFFFLLPGKTGHREWYITDLQTRREWSERTADGLALWRTPLCPRGRGVSPFPCRLVFCPGPLRPGRSERRPPALGAPSPPQRWPRWWAPAEPVLHRAAGSGSFSWATLSSL